MSDIVRDDVIVSTNGLHHLGQVFKLGVFIVIFTACPGNSYSRQKLHRSKVSSNSHIHITHTPALP